MSEPLETPDELDPYDWFATIYLSPWGNGDARAWLDERRAQGFLYEGPDAGEYVKGDRGKEYVPDESELHQVSPEQKKFLHSIVHFFRLPGNHFEIQFDRIDPRYNSDCMGAVEDYLRVFACESGFFDTFPESVNLFGDIDGHGAWKTTFPGLTTRKEDPLPALGRLDMLAGQNTDRYGYNTLTVHIPVYADEVEKALHALLRQVERAKEAAAGAACANKVKADNVVPHVTSKQRREP